jgi:hypothetical protein
MTRHHHNTSYVPYFQVRPKFCPTIKSIDIVNIRFIDIANVKLIYIVKLLFYVGDYNKI